LKEKRRGQLSAPGTVASRVIKTVSAGPISSERKTVMRSFDYLQELQDMGVDDDRIALADDYKVLYDTIMDECSEENFPATTGRS